MATTFLCFSSTVRLASVRTPTCTQRLSSATQNNVAVEPEIQTSLESEDESADKDCDVGHQYSCLKNIHLPEKLDQAIKKVLSSYSKIQLLQDGEEIMRYIQHRKPPLEKDETKGQTKGSNKVDKSKHDELERDNGDKSLKQAKIQSPMRYEKDQSIAYAASRAPAVYGTTFRVMNEIATKDQKFQPSNMLDFGSGIGTAIWAANEVWKQSIDEYRAIDVSIPMGDIARAIRLGGDLSWTQKNQVLASRPSANECIHNIYFKQFLSPSNEVQYDLVVSAYTLSELPTISIRKQLLASLWRKTKEYLILLEYGNYAGHNLITESRDFLLKADNWKDYDDDGNAHDSEGHVFAPCPHDLPCPLVSMNKRCYFEQKVELSVSQKLTPLKRYGAFSEPFSYLVMKKDPRPSEEEGGATLPRVIRPVGLKAKHIRCRMCCPHGKTTEVVLTKKKDNDIYKETRKNLSWGDNINIPMTKYINNSDEQASYFK